MTQTQTQTQAAGHFRYDVAAELIADLGPFIEHLSTTDAQEWQLDRVRGTDEDGAQRNCFFGHLFNWAADQAERLGYAEDPEGFASAVWDAFEQGWSTTYVIYPINDGANPEYQQPTAKERVIAYLRNLRDGVEEDTCTGLDRDVAQTGCREVAATLGEHEVVTVDRAAMSLSIMLQPGLHLTIDASTRPDVRVISDAADAVFTLPFDEAFTGIRPESVDALRRWATA